LTCADADGPFSRRKTADPTTSPTSPRVHKTPNQRRKQAVGTVMCRVFLAFSQQWGKLQHTCAYRLFACETWHLLYDSLLTRTMRLTQSSSGRSDISVQESDRVVLSVHSWCGLAQLLISKEMQCKALSFITWLMSDLGVILTAVRGDRHVTACDSLDHISPR